MATDFVIPTETRFDEFKDRASVGDAKTYSFDARPWQDDNSSITGATWTVEYGDGVASISAQSLASGVASALITLTEAGRVLISILLTTATQSKKLWLEIGVKDFKTFADDYGYSV